MKLNKELNRHVMHLYSFPDRNKTCLSTKTMWMHGYKEYERLIPQISFFNSDAIRWYLLNCSGQECSTCIPRLDRESRCITSLTWFLESTICTNMWWKIVKKELKKTMNSLVCFLNCNRGQGLTFCHWLVSFLQHIIALIYTF